MVISSNESDALLLSPTEVKPLEEMTEAGGWRLGHDVNKYSYNVQGFQLFSLFSLKSLNYIFIYLYHLHGPLLFEKVRCCLKWLITPPYITLQESLHPLITD